MIVVTPLPVLLFPLAALLLPLQPGTYERTGRVPRQPVECVPAVSAPGVSATSSAIDTEVWLPVCAAVASDDIDALGRTYHPAAVLVTEAGTVPIGQALARWKQDAAAARQRGTRATVEFRFDRRQDDGATAFESGIFKYATTDAAGAVTAAWVPFEALFVRHDGRWLMLMERQLRAADEAAWNALPH